MQSPSEPKITALTRSEQRTLSVERSSDTVTTPSIDLARVAELLAENEARVLSAQQLGHDANAREWSAHLVGESRQVCSGLARHVAGRSRNLATGIDGSRGPARACSLG